MTRGRSGLYKVGDLVRVYYRSNHTVYEVFYVEKRKGMGDCLRLKPKYDLWGNPAPKNSPNRYYDEYWCETVSEEFLETLKQKE